MLRVEHIGVDYGETRILRDVSLQVPPGQVVCLLGRNGVGKTTLLKAIMGLLELREGSIAFDGQSITRWPSFRRARSGIGYVPQGRGIFPFLSVNENLLIGLEANTSRRAAGSAVAEMWELFPVLYTMRGRVAGTLSGGQQQQLALARALVSRPRLVLLDEPTEGIQPSIMDQIADVIVSLHQRGDIGILLVEQFLEFALGVASYFYIMETGAIAKHGPTAEFDHASAHEFLTV